MAKIYGIDFGSNSIVISSCLIEPNKKYPQIKIVNSLHGNSSTPYIFIFITFRLSLSYDGKKLDFGESSTHQVHCLFDYILRR